MNKYILKLLITTLLVIASAHSASAADWDDFIKKAKPILDYRLRYENVDQTGIANKAGALTSRLRAGFETGAVENTKFLVDFESVSALSDKYNSTVNGKTTYPIVADPTGTELNRLQLSNTSLPQTTVTIGRQLINLDDQRFVGAVAWRDNEQTFDAVRAQNTSIPNLTLDAAYSIQTNRVFGDKSPVGRVEGDTILLNAGYKTPIGTLTAFGYLLKFDNAALYAQSSKTFGLRFAGARHLNPVTLNYAFSYANQKNAYNNPASYSADYYLAEGSAVYGGFTAAAGYELLGSGGAQSFQTPLATLHKFNGWADKFLTIPANGLQDLYGSLGYTFKKAGPFQSIGLLGTYHDFKSDTGNSKYGDEYDLQLLAKIAKLTLIAKYADYKAKGLFTDTRKIWFSLEYSL
jgi:hypothetical protein